MLSSHFIFQVKFTEYHTIYSSSQSISHNLLLDRSLCSLLWRTFLWRTFLWLSCLLVLWLLFVFSIAVILVSTSPIRMATAVAKLVFLPALATLVGALPCAIALQVPPVRQKRLTLPWLAERTLFLYLEHRLICSSTRSRYWRAACKGRTGLSLGLTLGVVTILGTCSSLSESSRWGWDMLLHNKQITGNDGLDTLAPEIATAHVVTRLQKLLIWPS
jgi:fucose 4-O-acetylase-like acetyltransferase